MDDNTATPEVQEETTEEVIQSPDPPVEEAGPSQLDRIEQAIVDLGELVRSVVGTFSARAIDDGATVRDDGIDVADDEVEISDELPDSPYERDYTLDDLED